MVRRLLAATIVVATAQAGVQASVELAGDAPFSRGELDDALALRLSGGHRIAIVVDRDDVAVVTVDGRSRTVHLGARRGTEAARLVALVAAGLSIDAPDPIDAPPAHAPARPTSRRPSIAVSGIAGAADGALARGIGAELAGGGALAWIVAVGIERRTIAAADEVTLHRVPARFGVVARRGGVELGAAAVFAFVVARGGRGDQALSPGLTVTGGVALPLTAAWAMTARAGVDAMATRQVYRWDGLTIATSGRLSPWLAVGLRWEVGR